MLTAKQAAQYLQIRLDTLYFMVKNGRIRAYRLPCGKRTILRFRRVDLDNAMMIPLL